MTGNRHEQGDMPMSGSEHTGPSPRVIVFDDDDAGIASEHFPKFPEIVCLSGSTRFKDEYREENARLTLEGRIVLSVGFFHHADGGPPGDAADLVDDAMDENGDWKRDLDHLHFRKIDLADRLHVINVDGYVGESTRNEIDYAIENGTDISWLNSDEIPEPYDTEGEQ